MKFYHFGGKSHCCSSVTAAINFVKKHNINADEITNSNRRIVAIKRDGVWFDVDKTIQRGYDSAAEEQREKEREFFDHCKSVEEFEKRETKKAKEEHKKYLLNLDKNKDRNRASYYLHEREIIELKEEMKKNA